MISGVIALEMIGEHQEGMDVVIPAGAPLSGLAATLRGRAAMPLVDG